MTSDLRFGTHGGQQYVTYPEYVKHFQRAEELGLDWCSDFDHFLPIQVNPDGPCYDGLTMLAGLAPHTKKIQLGILVTGVTYRDPTMLANIAVTLDHISNGRFELGMGAAWYELEHNQYGIPFPSVGERMDRLEEAIQIVRSMFTQTTTTFEGKYYQVKDARCEPKPLKHIPIWVGGAGEKRTLKIVAHYADGWNIALVTPEEYRHKLDVLEAHCKDAQRNMDEIRRSIVFWALLDKDAATARQRLAEREARLGDQHVKMNETAIVGTPQECIERLKPFLHMGVKDFLLMARPPADDITLQLFATEVTAGLRAAALQPR